MSNVVPLLDPDTKDLLEILENSDDVCVVGLKDGFLQLITTMPTAETAMLLEAARTEVLMTFMDDIKFKGVTH